MKVHSPQHNTPPKTRSIIIKPSSDFSFVHASSLFIFTFITLPLSLTQLSFLSSPPLQQCLHTLLSFPLLLPTCRPPTLFLHINNGVPQITLTSLHPPSLPLLPPCHWLPPPLCQVPPHLRHRHWLWPVLRWPLPWLPPQCLLLVIDNDLLWVKCSVFRCNCSSSIWAFNDLVIISTNWTFDL